MFFSHILKPYLSYPCVYPKDYIIKNEGQRCEMIGIIIKGRIELHHYSETGDVSVLATLGSKEAFGDVLIMSDHPYHIGSLITTTPCEIQYLSKEALLRLIEENADFRHWYLRHMANKAASFNLYHKLLHQPSMQAKVLYYLHMMQAQAKGGNVFIKSHEHLAQILNVQRPSLSRCLRTMKQEGLIDYQKRRYWLL